MSSVNAILMCAWDCEAALHYLLSPPLWCGLKHVQKSQERGEENADDCHCLLSLALESGLTSHIGTRVLNLFVFSCTLMGSVRQWQLPYCVVISCLSSMLEGKDYLWCPYTFEHLNIFNDVLMSKKMKKWSKVYTWSSLWKNKMI